MRVIQVGDINNSPWMEAMFFLSAAIYSVAFLTFWVVRRRKVRLTSQSEIEEMQQAHLCRIKLEIMCTRTD